MRILRSLLLALAVTPATLLAQAATPGTNAPTFEDLAAHYDYSRTAPLNFQERGVEKRGKALVIDLEYNGTGDDDHVPAYLVVPPGEGLFPGIIWGHWMMPGSPMRSRDEFLEEAVALAQSGVMSLLIDAPMVRPGYAEESREKEPLRWAQQASESERQQVVDLRRAVDLLLSRRGIDKHHIAFVGHSYNAHAGAILAAVEKRITAFVLMAGSYADEEWVRNAKTGTPAYKWREQLGQERLDDFYHEYAWDDPVHFLGHTEGQSIFLQFATQDAVPRDLAQKYLDRFSAKDKKMEFYNAGHALNAEARLDRVRWLQQRLKFKKVDETALKEIPQLK